MFRVLSKNKCKNCKHLTTLSRGLHGEYIIPNHCKVHAERVSKQGYCDRFEPNSKTKENYRKF